MKPFLLVALFLVAQVFGQANNTTMPSVSPATNGTMPSPSPATNVTMPSPSPAENLDTVSRNLLFIYYDFDNVNNNTVTDLSSNGHNGQVVGNTSLVAGKFGKAMLFQNNLNGDQLVNAGAIDVPTQSFSVMAWVTVLPVYANTSANMKIVSKKTTWDETKGFELQYNPAEKKITFLSSGTNLGTAENVTLDETFHHVAALVNGTTVRIFVDGKDVTTDGNIDAVVANVGKEMLVGSSNLTAPAGGAWVGSIDEFRIYTVTLTNGQLMWVMNGSDLATTQPSPSVVPSAVPSVVPTAVPSGASPSALPSRIPPSPSSVVIPVNPSNVPEEVSSAPSQAVASFIVVVSVFFCIFMM